MEGVVCTKQIELHTVPNRISFYHGQTIGPDVLTQVDISYVFRPNNILHFLMVWFNKAFYSIKVAEFAISI